MKDSVFIHAIGRNNFARFIKKSTDGPNGENFNAFYIPETADPSQTLPTLSPQWSTHKNSTLVAFEGSSTAFEGGFARNAVSSPFFLDAQEENMPDKLHFIQTSYLQKTSMSPRAIFSVSRFIEKADGKFAKRQIKFSDTIFADGKRAPMLLNSLGSYVQSHNEAHIRGALFKIKYIVINGDNLVDYTNQIEQIGNAFSLHQMITNKRDDVVKFPNKPENIKLLNNFIDIEILRGTLALQKIAHLQRMLKYHELNPTSETNQEMQLSFSYKDKKSRFAFSKSLISKDEFFSIGDGEISKNQEIWINSQKTKIQKEIDDIYREIEVFSSSFEASEDSPLKTLKSTAERVQAIIYSSSNQDNLEKNYEQEQDRIKSWEESAKTNLQLRSLFKKKIIFDLQKEVPFRILQTKFRNNSQLSEFKLQNFLTNGGLSLDKIFQDIASKKLDYAIIGIGSIFLKNKEEAKIFMTAFSAFDKEFQKSILENAIINHNNDFVKSVLKHKSEDPAYFVFSAIFNRDLEGLETHLRKKGRDKRAMIPFDTPIHLATQLENNEAIKVIIEKSSTSPVNAKNDKQETPLHIASRNGSVSTAEILLENGAKDSKSKTDQGPFSVAHMASMHGHTNILKILCDFNLNGEGPNSETPTFMAIKNRYSDTAKFIIGKLNANSLGIKSSTTLTLKQIATKIMDYQSLKLLIDYQVTEKKLSTDQFTALHYSAQNGDVKSTILILEKCTPAHRKTQLENLFEGKTPLAMAIMHNRYEVTKILLDNSPFDIDKPFTYSSNGFNYSCEVTPLQAAILNRNLRITKLLLSSGRFDANKGVELIDNNVNVKPKNKEISLSLLDLAIFINSFEVFNLLLKSGVEISQNIEKGRFKGHNSLHLAAGLDPSNISIVKALIQSEKLDINAKIQGNSLFSAIHIAMIKNRFEVTKFLFSKGAEIDNIFESPQSFIQDNNSRIVEFFLENKLARINEKNLKSYPEEWHGKIIYGAVKDNCTNLLRQLLDTDIYKIDKVIPLAISQKNPEIFNLFLEKLGEDVDMNTFGIHNGLTLLHNAIRQKNSEVVKILLQRKEADPNQLCSNITALEFAMQIANASQDSNEYIENASTVKALLNANADIERITEEKERKLLLYIASENGNLEVVKSLLSQGVKADTYFYDFNAIHASIINGNNEITKILLKQDDLNISCPVRKIFDKNYSLNALELAIKEDNLEILEIMLSKNIDLINKPNFRGLTLLQFAIEENKFDAFKLLIDKGADYNFKLNLDQAKCNNKFEYTPLGFAIFHKKIEMVKFLVEKEVNVDDAVFKDKESKTLLNALQFIARYEKEDTEILGFLLDKGARTDINLNEQGYFKGFNLLQFALFNKDSNNDKTLDILIDRIGFDTGTIKEGNLQGFSTFQIAVILNNRKAVNKLLLKGARIDEVVQKGKYEGFSTLDLSAMCGSENLIKDLLLRDLGCAISLKTPYIQNIFIKDYREAIGIFLEKTDIDLSTIIDNSIVSANITDKKYFFLTFLQSAILQNQEEMVDFLLSKNAKVDKRITQGNHIGDNSIHLCIKNSESTAIFSKLLPQSNLEEYDSRGLAPIHLMVENFKYKFMEIYLDLEGANPNIPTMHSPKYTALHLAINNGDKKMTEILLTKADVNVLDEAGLAPIHSATIKEHYGILEILISHPQININETAKDGEYKGYSALHIAIINENTKSIEILLKNDQIDVNKPIEDGQFKSFSPLELAVYLNIELSLKALLDCKTKKIDVKKIAESGNNKGYTPLLWTIIQHKLPTAKQLVEAGADINEVIKTEGKFFGLNYLQSGLFHCNHKELVTFLMKNANKKDFDKPIEEGIHKGSTTISIIMNKDTFPYSVCWKEDHQILLEKLLPKTIAQFKASQLSAKNMKMLPEGMVGALAEAGAGAGAGSWSEASAGMGPRDDFMDIPIDWAKAYSIAGSEFGEPSIDGEGGCSSSIFGEGGISSAIPAILVSYVDQFSKESLQQKYIEIMREVDSDFKREYGEEIFESHKELLETKYKEFIDKGNENLEEYLGNATKDTIEDYKKTAEKQITNAKSNNKFDSIYSGLLTKKHLEFLTNQYEAYQAFKKQAQAPNSFTRQQLSVSTNSAQITAQADSNPAQNITQFVRPNPNAQRRQIDSDDRSDAGSERATKRARF